MGHLSRDPGFVITVYGFLILMLLLVMLLSTYLGGWDATLEKSEVVGSRVKAQMARDWARLLDVIESHLPF